ncbi:MAG: glycoside hydrolase family 16 protein [Bryobacteraceae bacterium]|nr:glycoside hydrolase family 16 protein [Bryobacteraceae bacterium]
MQARNWLVPVLVFGGVLSAAEWRLVWSDEFDAPGAPDPAKWKYEQGYLRNGESQYYTTGRPENARVENGALVIEARKEAYPTAAGGQAEYTSASLITDGTAAWRYGRVEVRAKLPTGRGTWPAIWMLGSNIHQVDWPNCGEIDIMENVGFDPDTIHGNIHTEAYNHASGTNKGARIAVARPFESFHVYAIEWFEDRIDFFVDERKYFTYLNEKTGAAAWPFDQPFFLILNVAIGGSWGGQQGIDDSIFPQRMEVDYVRVYQAHGAH